jgi:hypothetical protein
VAYLASHLAERHAWSRGADGNPTPVSERTGKILLIHGKSRPIWCSAGLPRFMLWLAICSCVKRRGDAFGCVPRNSAIARAAPESLGFLSAGVSTGVPTARFFARWGGRVCTGSLRSAKRAPNLLRTNNTASKASQSRTKE